MGTEGGAIHVYGDGFQFARTWLTEDPNEVVAIVPLFPNKILTVFGDNSIVAMELPSLEVVDLLSSSWLPRTFGDITAVHCDTVGEKNFVYLGTSEGVFIVLDVMESMIRVCEFQLSKADFGLGSKEVSISDIQISPKDEKFIGVGFEGGDFDEGYVVIYDLVKHKVHKSFPVPSVSTMAWHHSGDFLYAGTRKGELYIINVEKSTCLKTWSAEDELISSEDDGEEAWAAIRRISWLAPQKEDEEGCLFLMLGRCFYCFRFSQRTAPFLCSFCIWFGSNTEIRSFVWLKRIMVRTTIICRMSSSACRRAVHTVKLHIDSLPSAHILPLTHLV